MYSASSMIKSNANKHACDARADLGAFGYYPIPKFLSLKMQQSENDPRCDYAVSDAST